MKRILLLPALLLFLYATGQVPADLPAARQQFRDNQFGMFIHWGLSSVFGSGEWVMQNRQIRAADYRQYLRVFNPVDYDPEQWVLAAKKAGMKYIVFITRHHDGFSNWDTRYSDWKITNTPYGKDALRMLADACRKHNMQLGLYYSTLDWFRDDYPRETGRTGQYSGRTGKSDYAAYLQFMKNQLTELLTNYGPIMSIWLDGHWDQTNPEGTADRRSRIDWKYEELYGLVHRLQPTCLIGNNHHLDPIPGEDFQMFEKDLPGENLSGLSFQQPADSLPLETCETMNDSWGYNITDHHFKTTRQLVHLLVNAASRNANLLLNVGPMPNGQLQPAFRDTLHAIGEWMQQYGRSVYGTRGKLVPPQTWGVVTRNDKEVFIHLLNKPAEPFIFLPGLKEKPLAVSAMVGNRSLKWKIVPEGLFIYPEYPEVAAVDYVLVVRVKE